MSDGRRNQQGKSDRWSDNPLNAAAGMLAAAWGTAVGIGCAVLGIKRSGRGKSVASAGPLPERPEMPAAARQPRPGAGAQGRQKKAAEPKPAPSAKVAPIGKETGRRAAAGAEATRRGPRQASPAKQGAAAKAPNRTDNGAPPQRPSAKRGKSVSASAGPRRGARAAARPKATEKHPAPPQPGAAARAEPPAAGGPPAMAPATAQPERPPALDRPRGGKADDLKQITGVGPKLEEKLNGLGIYHYDQIASWGDSTVAWIDAELQAKGRVKRDNWVGQAAALRSRTKPSGS